MPEPAGLDKDLVMNILWANIDRQRYPTAKLSLREPP